MTSSYREVAVSTTIFLAVEWPTQFPAPRVVISIPDAKNLSVMANFSPKQSMHDR